MLGELRYKYEGKMENGIEQKQREKIKEKIEKEKKKNFFQRIKKREFRENYAHKTQQQELSQENLIVFEVSEWYLPVMETKRCYI